MNVMAIPKELYTKKFAEYSTSIKILYLIDDTFKMICDEYCESVQKSEKFKNKIEKNFQNVLEFKNLSNELEEEILFYLINKL
jgi:hypothetical protein